MGAAARPGAGRAEAEGRRYDAADPEADRGFQGSVAPNPCYYSVWNDPHDAPQLDRVELVLAHHVVGAACQRIGQGRLGGVAGQQQDKAIGRPRERVESAEARGIRQVQVRDDEIDRRAGIDDFERLHAGADVDDAVAEILEHRADVHQHKVVVVDSGSTDGTQAIVQRFPITFIQIRPEDFTYGFALNRGIAQTDAEIIATLSAHSLPANPDWLRALIEPFQDPTVAGVYGRQRPRSNSQLSTGKLS